MLAIELRTSIDWAREILGTASIASAVTPCFDRASSNSGLSAGLSTPTKMDPFLSFLISEFVGALTVRTTSAPQASAELPILAPAAS